MPAQSGRKRPSQENSISIPSKRVRKTSLELHRPFTRERSPSKNVHFSSNLVLGPNEYDPSRRSQSPIRSALHVRDEIIDSPSAQLQAEQEATQSRAGRNRKRNIHPTAKVQKQNRNSESQISLLEDDLDVSTSYERSSTATENHNYVCSQLNNLKSKVLDFAETFPHNRKPDALFSLLKPENKQLIRYIGCLAMGGKGGAKGWEALLADSSCRLGFVFGIVGRALKENVFDELCFGADTQLNEILSKQEQDHVQQDGFFRTRERADTILKHEKKLITPSTLHEAVASVTMQLERLLLPLWKQGSTAATWKGSHRRRELADIVECAAHLSRTMRKDRDTVYYWPPTFKDEEFEPHRMECFNISDMIRESPYDRRIVRGSERAILRPGHEHQNAAIVRVVCFPGLVSYQQGGGDPALLDLADENPQQSDAPPDVQQHRMRTARRRGQNASTGVEGFRAKVICKSVVLLQWGQQRLLTKEAGTSAHLSATKSGDKKYAKDYEGFVELYDLFLDEMARLEITPPGDALISPRQSWLPNVSRLFSRSPSVQPEIL